MKKTNIEWLKENLTEREREITGHLCCVAMTKIDRDKCEGVDCTKCSLNEIGNLIDWLLSEHVEKIKLTKFEYDLITMQPAKSVEFRQVCILMDMKSLGYYKDIKDTSMFLDKIIGVCEVVENEEN